MKIGILTGGGDVPGLNACIKSVVDRVSEGGHSVVGIRRGWRGLLDCEPGNLESIQENTVLLNRKLVRTIDRSGGTFLHTSRTNPVNIPPAAVPDFLKDRIQGDGPQDFTEHILTVLEELGIDALIPIGGDDTLSYALRLHQEGVSVIAVPKTMDNDVRGTDYCIGFSTAITRSVAFIQNLRTSTGSHERIAVIELFGRNSGQTSLIAAYLSGADRAVISEVPFDPDKLAGFLLEDKRSNPSNYSMMTISEGSQIIGGDVLMRGREDEYGHKKLGGIGVVTGDLIKEITGEDILYQQLGYLMRSGSPDSLDLMVAKNFGINAADLVVSGRTGRMMALRNGSYTDVPINLVREGARQVDVEEMYDVDEYRPKIRHMDGKPMFLY
ncbi:MAG: ATP-dependent 6-phosphofructokinase [Chloroflexi bacterium]|nr:ATP-dependent 6-phosphofructokinase [Chloroflexota bacterium]